MDGVLVVDKPSGPTSFDVVRRMRAALKTKKAGHTGTLDPLATGVMAVCLGEATKVAGFISEGDKAYDAVVTLGVETDTYDAQGRVVAQKPVPALSAERLEEALAAFRGPSTQTPPMYSAVKVAGRKLYELARAGEEVERPARPVTVHALTLKRAAGAELELSLRCSKGFFVRTLAHELGRALGCGAHLKALRRTASGGFTLGQATPLDELLRLAETPEGRTEIDGRLVSLDAALADLPATPVTEDEARRVAHGVPLAVTAQGRLRVLGPTGRLLAIAEAEDGRLRYLRVFGANA